MKSSKLFWKVFLACAVLMVFSAGVFGLLVTREQSLAMRSAFYERLRMSAILLGRLVEDPLLDGRSSGLQPIVHELGDRLATVGSLDEGSAVPQSMPPEPRRHEEIRLTVVDVDGRVLADSEKQSLAEVAAMDNHLMRPEIQAALQHGYGRSQRHSVTIREPFVYYAVPITRDGQDFGFARVSLPVRTVQSRIDRVEQLVWLCVVLISLVAIAGTYYLVARMIRPLTTLTGAVERIAAGNFPEHIHVADRDEVGMLARSFNRMSDELASRIAELRERGDQLAAVLGGMVEGVVAVDDQARILFANKSAGRLFDFDAAKSRGRALLATIRHETLHRSVRQSMDTRDVVNARIELTGPANGTLAMHATPLPGDPCPGVVLVLYDMTELRRLELLRQEFVTNVSHELKTPLSSIKAYAETLREGAINDPQHNREFVQRIEDQADRLHELILDLISLARIESGQRAYEVSDVEVAHVVDACLEHYQPSAQSQQLSLQAEPPTDPLVVRADEEALRQILDNLVNNAIKYTSPGGRVRVGWQLDGRSALIEVSDTGIGVSPQDQPRLFERFFRVDKARSRELGGTGLGLSIVKHLAQFFGGSVGVRSTPGKGSVFWVRLPLTSGHQ